MLRELKEAIALVKQELSAIKNYYPGSREELLKPRSQKMSKRLEDLGKFQKVTQN